MQWHLKCRHIKIKPHRECQLQRKTTAAFYGYYIKEDISCYPNGAAGVSTTKDGQMSHGGHRTGHSRAVIRYQSEALAALASPTDFSWEKNFKYGLDTLHFNVDSHV